MASTKTFNYNILFQMGNLLLPWAENLGNYERPIEQEEEEVLIYIFFFEEAQTLFCSKALCTNPYH